MGVGLTTVPGTESLLYDSLASLSALYVPQLSSQTDPAKVFMGTYDGIPVGVPISLGVGVPKPGDSNWSNINALPTALSLKPYLPASASFDFQWHIQIADYERYKTPSFSNLDARPASSFNDLGGAFQILEGSLTSPNLKFLPWPAASAGAATRQLRAFRISVTVSVYSPLAQRQASFRLPASSFDKDGKETLYYIYGAVDSWANTLYQIKNNDAIPDTLPAPVPADLPTKQVGGVPDPAAFLRSLFTIAIDTLAPLPGQASKLTVLPKDQNSQVPQKLKEVLTQNPAYKVQAGVEIGAILENIVNAVANVFGFNKNHHKPLSSEVDVIHILAQALSLPIAVDINGLSSSKTLEPATKALIPIMDKVVDTSAIPSAPPGQQALGGVVPIGELTAQITALANDIVVSTSGGEVNWIPEPGSFGGSLLPIPRLVDFPQAGTSLPKPTNSVTVSLPMYITVPGSPVTQKISNTLGTFALSIPTIPVPQISVFRRYDPPITGPAPNFDMRISMDPNSAALFPTFDLLKAGLESLGSTLRLVLNAFQGYEPGVQKLFASSATLAKTVGTVLGWLNETAALNTTIGTLVRDNDNQYTDNLADAFFGVNGDNPPHALATNIASVAWIGVPNGYWSMSCAYYVPPPPTPPPDTGGGGGGGHGGGGGRDPPPETLPPDAGPGDGSSQSLLVGGSQSLVGGSSSLVGGSSSLVEGSSSLVEGSQSSVGGSQSLVGVSQSLVRGSQSPVQNAAVKADGDGNGNGNAKGSAGTSASAGAPGPAVLFPSSYPAGKRFPTAFGTVLRNDNNVYPAVYTSSTSSSSSFPQVGSSQQYWFRSFMKVYYNKGLVWGDV